MPSTPASTSGINSEGRISELIVVEGRTDVDRVSAFVSADFYCTNGFYVTKQTIADIVALSKDRGVVLFLDNDHAGELIRRRLQEGLPGCSHAYITQPWGKQGQVALASEQTILQALKQSRRGERNSGSLSWLEFLSLDLTTDSRRYLCNALKISFCNNKQFFKRMVMMSMTKGNLVDLLNESL